MVGEGHCDEEKVFLSPSVASMEPCPPTALAIAFAGVVVYRGKSLGAVAGSVQAAQCLALCPDGKDDLARSC